MTYLATPNPYRDSEHPGPSIEPEGHINRSYWRAVFAVGCFVLAACLVCARVGWGTIDIMLAPMGIIMIVGSGTLLAVERRLAP